MNAVKVLVADPSDEGAEQIAKLLATNPRIEVLATARTGAECIRKAALTRPHVITMDLQFKDMNAAQVISTLSTMPIKVSVYLIGPYVARENPMLQEALDAGAFDFIRCRRTLGELETYQRQIINTIFVAGLSAAKQIPRKEGIKNAGVLTNLLKDKRMVAIGIAAERLEELAGFLAGIRVGIRADVVLIAAAGGEKTQSLQNSLRELVGFQLEPAVHNAGLNGGHLYFSFIRKQDLVVGIDVTGRPCLTLVESPGDSGQVKPRLDALFKSMAERFREKAAAILVGGDGTDGIYGLKAIQDVGGMTLVETLSLEFLRSLRKWLPNAKIPHAVAPLEDLRVLMKELA
ncbi:MAG: response regulator [Candidatus Riflebacteria bacterium]|nr:response regulator [Candidatus Riflebacteria bacterium]